MLYLYRSKNPKDSTVYYEIWFLFGIFKYNDNIISGLILIIVELFSAIFILFLIRYDKKKYPFIIVYI